MIRVNKSLNPTDIPNSLCLPVKDDSVSARENGVRKTTHARRMECINQKKYINEDAFNNRYKQKDVKELLKRLYNRKCAFCERKVDYWAVEHYRPKTVYFWLAFSWDNLLYSCQTCNSKKGDRFVVTHARVSFHPDALNNIHGLSAHYHQQEAPKLLHPELDHPEQVLTFTARGGIEGTDERAQHTIKACGLDREELQDDRYALLAEFQQNLEAVIVEMGGGNIRDLVKAEVIKFTRQARNQDRPFLAFRRYALKHLLSDVILSVTQSP